MNDQMPSNRPKILLMDDDAASREAMRLMFEHIDCTVILASNEKSAIDELFAHADIDMIICDIELKKDQRDKTGLIYAGVFRKMRDDIPLASYSARYHGLTPQELRIFELSYDKGSSSVDDLSNFARDCKSLAVVHREVKRVLVNHVPEPDRRIAAQGDMVLTKRLDEIERRVLSIEALDKKLLSAITRLETVEKNYYSREQIRGFFRTANIVFGLLAGLASIIGLWALFK